MAATMAGMRKRLSYLARRELLCDFLELVTMWCVCGAVLIALYLRTFVWGWF